MMIHKNIAFLLTFSAIAISTLALCMNLATLDGQQDQTVCFACHKSFQEKYEKYECHHKLCLDCFKDVVDMKDTDSIFGRDWGQLEQYCKAISWVCTYCAKLLSKGTKKRLIV